RGGRERAVRGDVRTRHVEGETAGARSMIRRIPGYTNPILRLGGQAPTAPWRSAGPLGEVAFPDRRTEGRGRGRDAAAPVGMDSMGPEATDPSGRRASGDG